VRRYGVPVANEATRRQRVRDQQREARKLVPTVSAGQIAKSAWEWVKDLGSYAQKFVEPVSDSLRRIHQKLESLINVREGQLSMRNKEQMDSLTPLADAIHQFSDDELSDFKSGWINPDERDLLDNLIKSKGLTKEWQNFLDIVKNNEQRFLDLGVLGKVQLVDGYLPRVVNDPEGLINAMAGTPEGTSFAAKIRAERIRIEKVGGKGSFDKAHEKEFIAKMVTNKRYNGLGKKFFEKDRTLRHVPGNLLQYYADPIQSMISYITDANELIFQRELVGKSSRSKFLFEMSKKVEKAERAKDPKLKEQLFKEAAAIAEHIQDIDEDTRMTLATLLQNLEITDQQRKEASDLINARLNQRGTSGAVRDLKNITLMMTIGNPLSAITQLGDTGLNIMDNGTHGLAGIAKALTGQELVSNFDIENMLREFSKEGGTSNVLNWLIDKSQLKRMDSIGKESYLQGSMKKYASWSFDNVMAELGHYAEFLEGNESEEIKMRAVHESMKLGKPSKNAMLVLFASLAQVQPVSLSQTSEKFLGAGQGRIFWVLKQFALRTISKGVMDAKKEFDKGNYVAGLSRALGLALMLGVAGAGTDFLKDMILGREPEEFSDSVMSNIMDILFINRYTLERGIDGKKPISSLIANNLMLPVARAADAVVNDVWATAQGDFSYTSMASVPMVGRIVFDYTPMGLEAKAKRDRRAIMTLIENGASQERVSGSIRDFNLKATGEPGLEKITSETIKNARKRGRE
jgi:hypothetical protein